MTPIITRRGWLREGGLAVAGWKTLGPVPGQPQLGRDRFLMRFPGAKAPSIGRVLYGQPLSCDQPRGPLGTEEKERAFRRTGSLGATTNLELTTTAFRVPPHPLRMNVDTLHGTTALTQASYVMMEVLDREGRVVPGFEREKCLIADVNALDHLLSWDGKLSSALAHRAVSLVILMRDARLYAIHTLQYRHKELRKVRLHVEDTTLRRWETTSFTLRGEAADGSLVVLDHNLVELAVSDPEVVIARTDKRDLHKGRLTVFGPVNEAQKVSVRAVVAKDQRKISSAPVVVSVTPSPEKSRSPELTLLFMEPADTLDVQGKVEFKANLLEYYAETRGLPRTPKGMTVFSRKIGGQYFVWGSSREEGGIFRGVTTDGIHFSTEPVTSAIPPRDLMDLTYNPQRDEYIAFERRHKPLHWFVHTSKDGLHFSEAGKAYRDHDSVELIWDPVNSQLVALSGSYQLLPKPKRYPDNVGNIPNLGNRCRRIFTRRTSRDGLHWTPAADALHDDPATYLEARYFALVPDADDPPDLEFYWVNVFPYVDRYLGFLMSYQAAPPNFVAAYPHDAARTGHGPHVKVEWIVSKDLQRFERLFRTGKAVEDWRIFFSHAPLILHDRLLFLTTNQTFNIPPAYAPKPGQNIEIYSLPVDRIASAGGAGASFVTKPFVAPNGPLHLNAAGSLAVEVLAGGRVVEGFEKARNRIVDIDELHHKLTWTGRDTTALAGRMIQLRFALDRARVFSVHSFSAGCGRLCTRAADAKRGPEAAIEGGAGSPARVAAAGRPLHDLGLRKVVYV